jgi:hypothetical protein
VSNTTVIMGLLGLIVFAAISSSNINRGAKALILIFLLVLLVFFFSHGGVR